MSLTYALVSGTTWVNGMSASATNLNNAVNAAVIAFQNTSTLVGRVTAGAGNMEDIPFGTFLITANNLSDVTASTARTNLGLGTSATHAATDFLLAASNLSDLANAGTARTNLSLGTANSPQFTGLTLTSGMVGVTVGCTSTSSTAAGIFVGGASTGSSNALRASGGTNTSDDAILVQNHAGTSWARFQGNGVFTMTGQDTGNAAATINGPAGQAALALNGSSTSGSSVGLIIEAGSNTSDNCALFWNKSGTRMVEIRGDGAVNSFGQLTNLGKVKVGGSAYDVPDANIHSVGTIHVTSNANSPGGSADAGLEMAYVTNGGSGSLGLGAITPIDRINSRYREARILGFPITFYAQQSTVSPPVAFTIKDATSSAMQFNNYGAGTLSTDASGNITATSDISLKKDIKAFNRGMIALGHILPISYRWKKSSGMETRGRYVGFSSQNVKKFIPEAVGKDRAGKLTLNDRPLIAALVNAVKHLEARVSALE